MRAGTAGDMAQQGTSRREYLNIALSQDQDLASDLLITPVDHTYTVDDQDDDVNRLPSSRDLFCRDRRWVAQYPDGGEEGEDEDEDPGSDGKEDGDGYELINRKRVDTVTQRGDYSSHSGRTTYDGSRGGRVSSPSTSTTSPDEDAFSYTSPMRSSSAPSVDKREDITSSPPRSGPGDTLVGAISAVMSYGVPPARPPRNLQEVGKMATQLGSFLSSKARRRQQGLDQSTGSPVGVKARRVDARLQRGLAPGALTTAVFKPPPPDESRDNLEDSESPGHSFSLNSDFPRRISQGRHGRTNSFRSGRL